MNHKRNAGFTLIEVLIVVVIMAVLAATIIPQFSTSTNDSRESAMKYNAGAIRQQIELYKAQHGNTPPDGANNLKQLTSATDAAGNTSSNGQVDATHPLGPYVLNALPPQPLSGLNTVKIDTGTAGTAPSATAAPGGGWIYRPATGEVWVDHPNYLTY